MSAATVTVEVPAELHATMQRCIAERDAGIAAAEDGQRSEWNKRLIDQAIDAMAATGQHFSANDLRPLLAGLDLPGPLFGNRFTHARKNRGVIKIVGFEPSNSETTHAKGVYLYVGTQPSS